MHYGLHHSHGQCTWQHKHNTLLHGVARRLCVLYNLLCVYTYSGVNLHRYGDAIGSIQDRGQWPKSGLKTIAREALKLQNFLGGTCPQTLQESSASTLSTHNPNSFVSWLRHNQQDAFILGNKNEVYRHAVRLKKQF